VAAFSPNENPKDGSNKFIAFANSRLRTYQANHQQYDEFVTHWELNAEASELLYSLPKSVADSVVKEFNVRSDTRDVNGRFMAFASSRLKNSDPITLFACSWGLSDESANMLRACYPATQEYIMANFNPPAGDVNERFRKYLKSNDSAAWSGNKNGYWRNGDAGDVLLLAFQQKWGLDDDAIGRLAACSPDVIASVMTEFNPKGDGYDTARINSRFVAFLRSRADSSGYHEDWKRQRTY